MQLHDGKERKPATVATLEELLLSRQEWPAWLDKAVALDWGIQLCRMVARLHRLGGVLGDLNPATILVSREGNVPWAPVLLVSWPPAPQFWLTVSLGASICDAAFPIAVSVEDEAFVAPERLDGVYDPRADVYSLGAILYLLFTRYAPIAAACRLRAERQVAVSVGPLVSRGDTIEGLELLAPSAVNDQLPESLERVLLRALELDPGRRYPSVFALVEALERVALEGREAAGKERKRCWFWPRLRGRRGGKRD